MSGVFDYSVAFSRNIGWFTSDEQAALREKRIAIAGMGGVGGGHLLTLARLGIARFTLADFDSFDLVNFNRQAGAMMSSLGQPKLDVLAKMARDVNPDIELALHPEGVATDRVDEFLAGADLYVDSLDFFAFDARRAVFAACDRLGIPAVTAAPLGMSTAVLVFMPGQMSFEEYFRLDGCSDDEMAVRFFLGLAPGALHAAQLVVPSSIDLKNRKGPSTIIGCQLCAGVAAAEAVKILLGRGTVMAAPHGYQFDPFSGRLHHSFLEKGNDEPEQIRRIEEMKRSIGIQ